MNYVNISNKRDINFQNKENQIKKFMFRIFIKDKYLMISKIFLKFKKSQDNNTN